MKNQQIMKSLFTFLLLSISFTMFGQYDIEIELKNYEKDTVIIGNYYADRQLVRDTLIGKEGKFNYEGQDTLEPGVYFVLIPGDNNFSQFFVNEADAEFKMSWNVKSDEPAKFKGSEDNEIFSEYVDFIASKRGKAEEYRARITVADSIGVKDEKAEKEMDKIDLAVSKRQQEIIEKIGEGMSSRFIKANQSADVPEFEGEDAKFLRYLYYKMHYFDNLDLGDHYNLRTPFIHNRVMYYMEKLTPQDPDSIKVGVDYLLDKMEPSPETFKYYLSFFLNKYAKLKIVGYDAVYVHIIDKYYSKGKAPWVTEENLTKMIDQANNFRPILIGKKFPDVTTYKADSVKTPVRIWDVESEYTVLLFWAHDCGHCTKSMPDVVDFYKEYESKGVTLISICTKGGKKMTPCQEAVPKKNMDNFINTFDEFQRYRTKVYIPSTPKIFILDKDKNILIKDIPSKELKNIMPEIFRIDKEKKIEKM